MTSRIYARISALEQAQGREDSEATTILVRVHCNGNPEPDPPPLPKPKRGERAPIIEIGGTACTCEGQSPCAGATSQYCTHESKTGEVKTCM